MFRESPSQSWEGITESHPVMSPDMVEGKGKRVELDENFFNNLESVAAKLPKSERKLYQGQLQLANRYVLHEIEREFNLLVPNPDNERMKMLQKDHDSLPFIAQLGEKLKLFGIDVPWVNPSRKEQILLQDEGKLDRVDAFRSVEEEQMLKLITKHDALKQTLIYAAGEKKVRGRLGLTDEQVESMGHIIVKFNQLPVEYKDEFIKLVNDDGFYHESLDRLRYQLKNRLTREKIIN